jgi:thiol-disulfide isomerase/thioredoxin
VKNILASLLAVAALSAPAAYAQNAGDTVTPDALGKLEWIKGEAPKAWEPGKLYVLECWATWCGPCVANIPHVDALFDKYADKGLRVIGVDVWEDGKDKVAEFVNKKGDGMSYPVAYTGKGGVFETEWLKPAKVQGIPHAFLVQDGKVLATVHPAKLTDEVVENLLKGGDDEKKQLDALLNEQKSQAALGKAIQAFTTAAKAKDADGMATATADVKALQPESIYVPLFESEVLITRGDWAGVEKALDAPMNEKFRPTIIGSIGRSITKQENVPVETLTKVTHAYETALEGAKKSAVDSVALSRLYWAAGNKDQALAQAKDSLELMKARSTEVPGLSAAPFEKFSAAVEGGTMPSDEEFNGWLKEALAARAATAIKPATPSIAPTPRTAATPEEPKAKE